MNRFLVPCLAALALAGCQSHPFSVDVAPRLTGRVLAADTGQPIGDVKITSLDQTGDRSSAMPPKGGQLLQAKAVVRTGPDGRFVLEAQRSLTPFSGSDWFSVWLVFEHAGYERYLTNYTYLNLGTNSVNGKPSLDAGKILMQRAAKE